MSPNYFVDSVSLTRARVGFASGMLKMRIKRGSNVALEAVVRCIGNKTKGKLKEEVVSGELQTVVKRKIVVKEKLEVSAEEAINLLGVVEMPAEQVDTFNRVFGLAFKNLKDKTKNPESYPTLSTFENKVLANLVNLNENEQKDAIDGVGVRLWTAELLYQPYSLIVEEDDWVKNWFSRLYVGEPQNKVSEFFDTLAALEVVYEQFNLTGLINLVRLHEKRFRAWTTRFKALEFTNQLVDLASKALGSDLSKVLVNLKQKSVGVPAYSVTSGSTAAKNLELRLTSLRREWSIKVHLEKLQGAGTDAQPVPPPNKRPGPFELPQNLVGPVLTGKFHSPSLRMGDCPVFNFTWRGKKVCSYEAVYGGKCSADNCVRNHDVVPYNEIEKLVKGKFRGKILAAVKRVRRKNGVKDDSALNPDADPHVPPAARV